MDMFSTVVQKTDSYWSPYASVQQGGEYFAFDLNRFTIKAICLLLLLGQNVVTKICVVTFFGC